MSQAVFSPSIRPPAVAGTFYPADPAELSGMVRGFLAQARPNAAAPVDLVPPKALIAPHAGYVYSGPIAGSAYVRLLTSGLHRQVRRVVMIGPAHRVAVRGLATSSAGFFATPLGTVPLDRPVIQDLLALPFVGVSDQAHAPEHGLEVQLPFLQEVLGSFWSLVPLIFGHATAEQAAAVLERAWGGGDTLIVISSDLSHYEDYATAQRLDRATSDAIEALQGDRLGPRDACGSTAVAGLLQVAARKGLGGRTVDLRNSGDTAGPRDSVVGYGAYVFTGPTAPAAASPHQAAVSAPSDAAPTLTAEDRETLVKVAWNSVAHGLRQNEPLAVDARAFSPPLRQVRATFVTLKRLGELRGCIGTLQAVRPLVEDVALHAYAAAFSDPRFPPLRSEELAGLDIHISILTPPRPVRFSDQEDLLRQIRPGVDGLILREGARTGTFLPAVWETLPDRRQFLTHLKQKAGLPPDYWSPTVRVERYEAVSVP